MRVALCCLFMLLAWGCQSQQAPSSLPAACQQPAETGMCRAAIQRYYFDADSGECRHFIWGGCGGSVPFETRQDCVQQCLSVDDSNKENP